MISVYLTSQKPPNCFPQWLYHFVIPPAFCVTSSFSTSSSMLGMISLFYFSHSNGYVVLFCISLMTHQSSFHVFIVKKNVYSFAHFFNRAVCCLIQKLQEFFIYSKYKSRYCRFLSPICTAHFLTRWCCQLSCLHISFIIFHLENFPFQSFEFLLTPLLYPSETLPLSPQRCGCFVAFFLLKIILVTWECYWLIVPLGQGC